jgi:two-component system OmpR family response regulator
MNREPESPRPPSMTVLVADDDEDMRALVSETLRADGHRVMEARDGEELIGQLERALEHPAERPDVVVTDVLMPRLSGLGVLDALRRAHWNVPVILMTVLRDSSVHILARRLGAVCVLEKPLGVEELRSAMLQASLAFTRSRGAMNP